jgi:hypothetical protein
MTADKIKNLIEKENESRERDTASLAADFIRAIGDGQAQIVVHQRKIEALRQSLKDLEHTPIDPATIKGIRIESLTIKTASEDGLGEISSEYVLVSSEDKVLAKQNIGGYNGMKVLPAADTVGALNTFLKLYKRDVNTVLGLETE